jgi:hypothetical protein
VETVSVSGIFLNAYDYAHLWTNPTVQETIGSLRMVQEEIQLTEQEIETNIERFESFCIKEGIFFRTHNEVGGDVFQTIRTETRFADLMIISNDMFYRNIGEQPNEYLQQVLHFSECAVLILPLEGRFPDSLILSYDGSPSSVFAIKQFAYLLPELCDKEAILITLEGDEGQIPQHALIEELAVRHFPKLSMQVMEKNADKHFSAWVSTQNHPLLVAGSFGRTGMSRLFRKSFITDVIKNNNTLVFIAHK